MAQLFSVPIATGAITDLNPEIAKGQDFSWIGNLPDAYFQGQDQAQKQRLQNLFKNGLPTLPNGDFDYPAIAQAAAKASGYGAIPLLQALRQGDIQQEALRSPNLSGVFAPPQRPDLPPSTQRSNGVPQADATPAPPDNKGIGGQVTGVQVTKSEGPDVFASGTTTARALANRTGQDPDTVASSLGVDPDEPITADQVRQKIDVIRNGPRFAQTETVGPATEQFTPDNEPPRFMSVGARVAPDQAPAAPRAPAAPSPQAPQQTQLPPPGGVPPGDPGFWTQENARAYEVAAARANAQAQRLAIGGGPQGAAWAAASKQASEQFAATAKQIYDTIGKSMEPTPGMKEATSIGTNITGLEERKAIATGQGKEFVDEQKAIQASGNNAATQQGSIALGKQMINQPGFWSGPANKDVQTFQQWRALFGANPTAALPMEAFHKLTQDMLQQDIKSMGQSGVGRVLRAEVGVMQNSIASLGITPAANRALLEMRGRLYDKQIKIADLAQNARNVNELNTSIRNYLTNNPMFSPEELSDPRLLGAPTLPPAAANWSKAQLQQWGTGLGLQPGDPLRLPNGQPGSVPR